MSRHYPPHPTPISSLDKYQFSLVHLCVSMEARGRYWVLSSVALPLIAFNQGLSITLELAIQRGWLASEPF